MAKRVKEKWKDGKATTEVAQTRCASSYDLLQMLYTTARDEKEYSATEVPENLNLLSIFEHWVQYQVELLGTLKTENNWKDGFEDSFKIKVYQKWNTDAFYHGEILSNSSMFIPQ